MSRSRTFIRGLIYANTVLAFVSVCSCNNEATDVGCLEMGVSSTLDWSVQSPETVVGITEPVVLPLGGFDSCSRHTRTHAHVCVSFICTFRQAHTSRNVNVSV